MSTDSMIFEIVSSTREAYQRCEKGGIIMGKVLILNKENNTYKSIYSIGYRIEKRRADLLQQYSLENIET